MSHAANASFNSSLLCIQHSVALTLPGASGVLKMSHFGLKVYTKWHVTCSLRRLFSVQHTQPIYTDHFVSFIVFFQTYIFRSGFISWCVSRILVCRKMKLQHTSHFLQVFTQLQRLNTSLWKKVKQVENLSIVSLLLIATVK